VDMPEKAPRGRAQAMQYAKRRTHRTPRFNPSDGMG
jgi:hypothetical protein